MKLAERNVWIVLSVLILMSLFGILLGGNMLGSGMMRGYNSTTHMSSWSWGLGMAFAWLGMLAILGALLFGGILLMRRITEDPLRACLCLHEDPRSLLRRRYAAGEIDQATYERMKRALEV